jgi:hypothetical protein
MGDLFSVMSKNIKQGGVIDVLTQENETLIGIHQQVLAFMVKIM